MARLEGAVAARPVALSGERLLPVPPAVAALLPQQGLRRGSTVAVSGGPGASSLAFALTAAASAAGSWCAAVGGPWLGLVAAAEVGIVLERFPVVSPPPAMWATTVAALVDAFEIVLVWLPARLRQREVRQLMARAREREAVLVLVAAMRPGGGGLRVDGTGRTHLEALEGVDVRLAVTGAVWHGLGRGHGHLACRQVEVMVGGRGAAARERRLWLWLPAPGGGVALAEEGNVSRGDGGVDEQVPARCRQEAG